MAEWVLYKDKAPDKAKKYLVFTKNGNYLLREYVIDKDLYENARSLRGRKYTGFRVNKWNDSSVLAWYDFDACPFDIPSHDRYCLEKELKSVKSDYEELKKKFDAIYETNKFLAAFYRGHKDGDGFETVDEFTAEDDGELA